MTQTAGEIVVFLLRTISPGLAQQFQGTMDAAKVVGLEVDRRVVCEVLSVVDGGFPDFANRQVDLSNGRVLIPAEFPIAILAFKVRPRVAEIDQSVQIGGVVSRRVGVRQQRRERQQGWQEKQTKILGKIAHGRIKSNVVNTFGNKRLDHRPEAGQGGSGRPYQRRRCFDGVTGGDFVSPPIGTAGRRNKKPRGISGLRENRSG